MTSFRKWESGDFDPKECDAGETTKAMKKGLRDWQNT